MNCRDFLPPVLLRFLKKNTKTPRLFASYADAQAVCRGGYEETDLVEVVFEKNRRIKDVIDASVPLNAPTVQSLVAILMATQKMSRGRTFNLLDFGGACGSHYFQLRPYLPDGLRICWVVVETPALAEKAKSFETDELRFTDTLERACEIMGHVHLFHSSGTLQYIPDIPAVLQSLLKYQPDFLFLNRLALSAAEKLITVQESRLSDNGPGKLPEGFAEKICRYPVTYFPEKELEDILLPHYRIQVRFSSSSFFLGDKEIRFDGGFLARLSNREIYTDTGFLPKG